VRRAAGECPHDRAARARLPRGHGGHEFHYSAVESEPGAPGPAWRLAARGRERPDGFATRSVQAGYLHVHWAAHPELARRFVRAASAVAVAP